MDYFCQKHIFSYFQHTAWPLFSFSQLLQLQQITHEYIKAFHKAVRLYMVLFNILKDIPIQFKHCSFLWLMTYVQNNLSVISSVHLKDTDKRQTLRQPTILSISFCC